MASRLFTIVFLVVLFGCQETEKKESSLAQFEVKAKQILVNKLPVYDYDGLEPMLHIKDDKTYIINFWATWCAPCVKELPYFEKINSEQKDNNVEVILVSLDMPKMWDSHLIPFIEKKKIESKVVILDDPKQNTWIPKVDKDWSGAIPATIIYNKSKRSFYEQSFTYEELMNELKKFVELN